MTLRPPHGLNLRLEQDETDVLLIIITAILDDEDYLALFINIDSLEQDQINALEMVRRKLGFLHQVHGLPGKGGAK